MKRLYIQNNSFLFFDSPCFSDPRYSTFFQLYNRKPFKLKFPLTNSLQRHQASLCWTLYLFTLLGAQTIQVNRNIFCRYGTRNLRSSKRFTKTDMRLERYWYSCETSSRRVVWTSYLNRMIDVQTAHINSNVSCK